jgi:hypothetical protein
VARVIQHQIHIAEPMMLLPLVIPKAQQWRGAWSDLWLRRHSLARCLANFRDPTRFRYLADHLLKLTILPVRGSKHQ